MSERLETERYIKQLYKYSFFPFLFKEQLGDLNKQSQLAVLFATK